MLVEIWSDIACPWCFIGKRRFEKAVKALDPAIQVVVQWKSFELSPTTPKGRSESVIDFLKRHKGISKAQALDLFPGVTKAAAEEDVVMKFDIAQHGNTFDAHRLIHYASTKGRGDAMKERLFSAYFERGESTSDISKLVEISAEIGLDTVNTRKILESDEFSSDVRKDLERGNEVGVTGVPFFLIDGKYKISGAQSPEAILKILKKAAGQMGSESNSKTESVTGQDHVCDEIGCSN